MADPQERANVLKYIGSMTRRIRSEELVVRAGNAKNILDVLDRFEELELVTAEETADLRALLIQRL